MFIFRHVHLSVDFFCVLHMLSLLCKASPLSTRQASCQTCLKKVWKMFRWARVIIHKLNEKMKEKKTLKCLFILLVTSLNLLSTYTVVWGVVWSAAGSNVRFIGSGYLCIWEDFGLCRCDLHRAGFMEWLTINAQCWLHLPLYFHVVKHHLIAIQSPKMHLNSRLGGVIHGVMYGSDIWMSHISRLCFQTYQTHSWH